MKIKPVNKIDRMVIAIMILVAIYLFVSAPVALDDKLQQKGQGIPVKLMFQIVAEENNRVRKQWTKHIVSDGRNVGFRFGENWHKTGEDKGPLPALFLREVAAYLEKSPVPLSLFLGSDFPLSRANKFKGFQEEAFQTMKKTNQNQYFFDNEVNRYTAMFPDNVVVSACADCHNEHADTPKNDWMMGDMMGATTWAYPQDTLTRDELIVIIRELRRAFTKTYTGFIQKSQTFANKPPVGEKWPADGYFLPSVDVFMQRFEKSAAESTLYLLLKGIEI
jgi:hypothetical protein